MAETINVFSSFNKRINSTRRPTGGSAVNLVLKHPTSVIHPTFIITGFNLSWNYIQWGTRYYFVDDIVILNANQAEYNCSLDVLATYKDTIGASSQYVTRAASASNLLIIDTKYPTYANTVISRVTFDSLHASFTNGGSFVVGVSNGVGVASGGVTYYVLNSVTMARLLAKMFDGTWLDAADISVELQKELVNPIQYIDSIKWYPFDIANSGLIGLSSGEIKFGYWGTGITAPIISAYDTVCPFTQSQDIPSHTQSSRGLYLNGAPYTQLSLICYGFGTIPIDASLFVATRSLNVTVSVDVMTGLGALTLRAGTNPELFYKQYGQIGVECKISQITQGLIESVGSTAGASFSLIAGNPLGFMSGIVSGVSALTPQITSGGTNGSKIAYVNAPELVIKRQLITPEDNAQLGRPVCDVMTISSLSGYIECYNVDIENVGTPAEKRSIIEFMEKGFFYE